MAALFDSFVCHCVVMGYHVSSWRIHEAQCHGAITCASFIEQSRACHSFIKYSCLCAAWRLHVCATWHWRVTAIASAPAIDLMMLFGTTSAHAVITWPPALGPTTTSRKRLRSACHGALMCVCVSLVEHSCVCLIHQVCMCVCVIKCVCVCVCVCVYIHIRQPPLWGLQAVRDKAAVSRVQCQGSDVQSLVSGFRD